MADIAAYRTAVLEEQIIAPLLVEIFDVPFPEDSLRALNFSVHRIEPDTSDFEEERRISSVAVKWLLLAAVADLAHQGQMCGYYQISSFRQPFLRAGRQVEMKIRNRNPEVANSKDLEKPLVEFLSSLRPLIRYRRRRPDQLDDRMANAVLAVERTQFQQELAAAQEAQTPELVECLRMLLFAGWYEWNSQISFLETIASMMEENPAVSLPATVMDTVEWAFNGAEEVLEWQEGTSRPPRSMHLTFSLLTKDSRESTRSRISQLQEVRDRIERAASNLTDDPVAAAAISLRDIARPDRANQNYLRRLQEDIERLYGDTAPG